MRLIYREFARRIPALERFDGVNFATIFFVEKYAPARDGWVRVRRASTWAGAGAFNDHPHYLIFIIRRVWYRFYRSENFEILMACPPIPDKKFGLE